MKAIKKANSYIMQPPEKKDKKLLPQKSTDPQTRVKELFMELVSQGKPSNIAAAEAIQLFAKEQQQQQLQKDTCNGHSKGAAHSLEPGPLNEGSWSVTLSLPATSISSVLNDEEKNEFNKKTHYYFETLSGDSRNDQLLPLTSIKIMRRLSDDGKGDVITGLQSAHGDNDEWRPCSLPYTQPDSNSTFSMAVTTLPPDSEPILCVSGTLTPKGFQAIQLLTTCDNTSTTRAETDDNNTETPFVSNLPEGYHLLGFHGTITTGESPSEDSYLTSLGLIARRTGGVSSSSSSLPPSPKNDDATKAQRQQKTLTTLKKYLSNAAATPHNPKFRTLKVSNKVFDRDIASIPGGMDVAMECGDFVVSMDFGGDEWLASIPLGLDLDGTLKEIDGLLSSTPDEE